MRRDFGPCQLTTLRSSKGNLLNARDSLGETIIEIAAADVAVHGEELERRLVEGFRKAGLPE
jgi:hypothetical protein